MLAIDLIESTQQIVVVAQAKSTNQAKAKKEYVMGVCQGIYRYPPTEGAYTGIRNYLSVNSIFNFNNAAKAYWGLQDMPEHVKSEHIQVLHGPKHGNLVYEEDPANSKPGLGYGDFYYTPDRGYVGNDKVTFKLNVNGKVLKVVYLLKVVHENTVPVDDPSSVCPEPENWRISISPYSTSVFSSDDSSLTTSGDYASVFLADFAVYDYQPPQITFRDLTGAAVGETTGEGANATINLDTDAAGHGWYEGGMFNLSGLSLDANFNSSLSPALSQGARGLNDLSNWLPTSNPNEWVARAGTAAEGKMDMLSVLLHEYGHALGIDHSVDSHDYMATTLTPGMRRLPSADAMQMMAQLAGEAREAIMAGNGFTFTVANGNTDSPAPTPSLPINMGFGISFLGLLRRNSSTSSIFANAAPARYDIAANTTLTNGNFASNNTNAWETTGKVNANNGAAVLSEVSTSQTRLNQVFVVGADDRYLSFTLSNIGLEDVSAGPDDAFEVALLNANTGASLTAPIGLTRTDALLNIQANGAELKATGVTSVINPDGSRTYVVDSM